MTDHYDNQDDAEPGFGRTPQHDNDAECCVLGGMMLSAAAIDEILDIPLKVTDFYRYAHGLVFTAILDLYGRGEPADVITVAALLDKNGDLGRVGGAPYLLTLINTVPTAANTGYYAEIVREKAKLRHLGEAGTRIVQMAHATDGSDADAVVDRAAAEIQAVVGDTAADGVASVADQAEAFLSALLDNDKPRAYLPVPYVDLQAAAPIEAGDLVIVAGATGMGKSVVMLDLARHAAIKHHKRTLLVSVEMNSEQVMQRLYAAEAQVPLHRLRGGAPLGDDDQARLGKAHGRILDAPFDILATGTVTLGRLRSTLRRMQARRALPELVVIDYLQIMTAEKETANRTTDVSALSRGLKQVAMDFGVPFVVGAQLNRQVNARTDKRPILSDLRESGSIEQDANIVVLLHRDEYYEGTQSPRAGELDLIVAKNRQGPTCSITVAFQGHFSRAADMACT